MANDREIRNFKHGTINSLEAQSIPDGAASDSLNWLTKGDRIELIPGYSYVGVEDETTGTKVTGLHIAERPDGTLIPFKTHGRKIKHYIVADDTWGETGSDAIPAVASGEDIDLSDYSPIAGNQLWINSPHMGPQKIMVANPGSIVDQYASAKNFKGRMRIKQARAMLWGRDEDKTGVYGSYVDDQIYTVVTAESIETGDGSTILFTGTLAFKGGGAKRTCFGVSITDGTELFTDDNNGVLNGSAGGTGTINYATGEYSVTFGVAPANLQAITSTYQWEDATNAGIADFTKSGTRLAGQGFIFAQDDGGGPLQAVLSFGAVEYCLHMRKSWQLEITADDTDATNLIYREKVGIPNHRAAAAADNGIYAIDISDPEDPKFVLITLDRGSTEVVPIHISQKLKIKDYRFDMGAVAKEGSMVFFAGRHKDSTQNDTLWIHDTRLGTFDRAARNVSCFGNQTYDGKILAGDSLSNNVMKLFDGWSNNGSIPDNYWDSNLTDNQIAQLKKTRRLELEGEIDTSQVIKVYADADNKGFVEIGEIRGDGPYVDQQAAVNIGSPHVGEHEIGGGGSGEERGHYLRELPFRIGKYRKVKLRFRAMNVGYASVSLYKFHDIIRFADRVPKKYRS